MFSFVTILVAQLMLIALARGDGVIRARAMIEPNCKQRFAYRVYGKVDLIQKSKGGPTTINLSLSGFAPNTVHGFHIHQKGDIHSKGCGSAGGHYNPFGVTHGGPNDGIRHVGDLGNIKADAKGKVHLTMEDSMVSLTGENSVAGRAFVIHAMRDDLGRGIGEMRAGSLKTGNAGARLACGIIYYS